MLFIYKSDVKTRGLSRVWNPSFYLSFVPLLPPPLLSTNFLFSLLLLLLFCHSLLLLFSIRPGRFAIRRANRQAPHSRSFRSIFAPPSPVSPRPSPPPLSPSRGHLGKELFIGQVSSPVTYVGRNRATPAKTEEI